MTDPRYRINEYVWDTVRDGPAIVVGIHDGVYTVAEIVEDRLGRIAHRAENKLCRYVKVILPEHEAAAVEQLLGQVQFVNRRSGKTLLLNAAKRLRIAIEKRGISWSQ